MRGTMRNSTQRTGALIVLVTATMLSGLLVVGCGRSSTSSSSSESQPSGTSASGAVSITNFAFTPATLTIAAGSTVTWTNNAPLVTHTVTSDDGSQVSFDHMLSPSDTFRLQFTQAGTYHYHCRIHPFMHGTIVVTTATATPITTLAPTATFSASPTPTT